MSRRPRPTKVELWSAFQSRFGRRCLIVHAGLGADWLAELLKVGGGGGVLRYDTRQAEGAVETPLAWVVRTGVLPAGLPLPLLVEVTTDALRIRHLWDGAFVCHPGVIPWLLADMRERDRCHAWIRWVDQGFVREIGLSVADNRTGMDDPSLADGYSPGDL